MAISIADLKTRLELLLDAPVTMVSIAAYKNGDIVLRLQTEGWTGNWDITRHQAQMEPHEFHLSVLVPLTTSIRHMKRMLA